MGFLDAVFGSNEIKERWSELKTQSDLEKANQASFEKPVVLFKHSVTCGVSSFAKSRLDPLEITDQFLFYYLDLLAHRDISNEIASRYGVIHQSPQILIIRNGSSVYDTSHHEIQPEKVLKHLSPIS